MTEPLPPESPLWTHERVRISSHIAARGLGRQARLTESFFENLRRYRSGEPLLDEV